MARSLDQILKSLDSVYNPQIQTVQGQINALPAQYQAQQAGLDTAKTNAFRDITGMANQRGVVYSGIPIAEQSRYVGEKYLPAVAGLQTAQTNQKTSLLQALQGINQDRYKYGQSIYQQEQDRAAQIAAEQAKRAQEERQFQQQLALSRRSGGGGGTAAERKASEMSELNQDIINAFAGFKNKPKYYTEDVILNNLYKGYPGMSQDAIRKAVYGYRKSAFGQ